MNDTIINEIVNTSVNLGTYAVDNSTGTLIKNVPNSLVTFLATTVIGLVIRFFEKKKLKKKLKAD